MYKFLQAVVFVLALSTGSQAFAPAGFVPSQHHCFATRHAKNLGAPTNKVLPVTCSTLPKPLLHEKTRLSSSASSSSSSNSNNNGNAIIETSASRFLSSPKLRPFVSTAALILWDVVFRLAFARAKIRFPSSLAGCGVLLAALLVQPNDKLYQQLQPGAELLAKWLPVFFVPSLVTLPLAEGLGSVSDLIKVSLVLVGGFFFTLLTTSYAVMAVRNIQSGDTKETTTTTNATAAPSAEPEMPSFVKALESTSKDTNTKNASIAAAAAALPEKPFTSALLRNLVLTATTSGLVGSFGFVGAGLAKYCTALSLLSATLASFVFGVRLPLKFTKIVHPLVTCTGLTWATVAALASLTGHTFKRMLRSYRTGSVWTGAGDVLLFLLGPAVVSLAISVYDRRKLVQENAAAVGTAVGVSTMGGVFGTALAVRLASIGIPAVRLSLVSRNITSPLAMAIASLLGADVSLAVSMVVITGLIGANFGASILNALGIHDPVARGLGMGSAAHGLGTAAFSNEKDAFPFAAIAMALTASATTVTVSIPVLRRIVLELALG